MLKDGVLTNVPFGWASGGNLTTLCPNGSKWVWEGLGECAQDARDMASIYLGLLSIFCFMMSSLPQYYSSCKTGNMDRALSIWFLLLWLGGDTCNLVGSFLADQLPLQTYTAVYYVLADLLMLAMYLYYKMKNRMAENRRVLHVMGLTCVLGVTTSFANLPGWLANQQEAMPSAYRGRTLLSSADVGGSIVDKTGFYVNSGPMAQGNDVTVAGHPKFTDAGQIGLSFTPKEIIGFSIGSVSSVLYLFSRLPQIYTNFKRKSTEGVSFFLFALVILGNTTYGLSVLLKNPDQGQGENSYVIHHLPWLIGSLGTLLLDLFISVQFISYRKASERLDTSSSETTPLMGS